MKKKGEATFRHIVASLKKRATRAWRNLKRIKKNNHKMTKGVVKGVVSNLVTVEVDGAVAQNEIGYITVKGKALMGEVIKIIGEDVYVQLFENTRGMKVGDPAEFTGHMLEVQLGPGLLSKTTMDFKTTSTRWREFSSKEGATPILLMQKSSGILSLLLRLETRYKLVHG